MEDECINGMVGRKIRRRQDEIGLQKRIAVDGTTHSDIALNCGVRWTSAIGRHRQL